MIWSQRTLRRLFAAVIAGGMLGALVGIAFNYPRGGVPARGDSGSSSVANGPSTGVGAEWAADSDPFVNGKHATLSEAQEALPPGLLLPSDSALAGTATDVWLGVQPASEGLLPKRDLPAVAVSYSTGVQVEYVPWQYGPSAPPLSGSAGEEHFAAIVGQLPEGSGKVTEIKGVPAMIVEPIVDGAPTTVEFAVGTLNQEAVEIVLTGRVSDSQLVEVAGGIIDGWQQRNPGWELTWSQ